MNGCNSVYIDGPYHPLSGNNRVRYVHDSYYNIKIDDKDNAMDLYEYKKIEMLFFKSELYYKLRRYFVLFVFGFMIYKFKNLNFKNNI